MTEYIGWIDDDWNTVLDQSQPIVRCRDCELEMNGYCSRPDEWNDDLWFPVDPDGFCKWGERKEVDE